MKYIDKYSRLTPDPVDDVFFLPPRQWAVEGVLGRQVYEGCPKADAIAAYRAQFKQLRVDLWKAMV